MLEPKRIGRYLRVAADKTKTRAEQARSLGLSPSAWAAALHGLKRMGYDVTQRRFADGGASRLRKEGVEVSVAEIVMAGKAYPVIRLPAVAAEFLGVAKGDRVVVRVDRLGKKPRAIVEAAG